MSSSDESPVLFQTLPSGGGYKIGLAVLNAPKSLNSLSRAMADSLLSQLRVWQDDPAIACVVLRGSGDKGFCAGGDVVKLRESSLANDGEAAAFFEQEYRLDYLIHVYRKPILAWGHGVVMGGGLGLLAGASHRVVTERTRLAMPEVTIGLYPDVGGSWFLNRMPGRCGLFLALTGVPINAADTQYLGLADHYLNHSQWDGLVEQISALSWAADASNHPAQLSGLLRDMEAIADERPESPVRQHYDQIQVLTQGATPSELFADITAYNGDDEWLSKAAKTLAEGCPTSVAIIYEQLRRTRHASLKEAFAMELVLSSNCMKYPNFAEGVRALLVDKDRQPKFEPTTLAEVTDEIVDGHFVSPWGAQNPLNDL